MSSKLVLSAGIFLPLAACLIPPVEWKRGTAESRDQASRVGDPVSHRSKNKSEQHNLLVAR